MSVNLPFPTTVESPAADARDSLSLNSGQSQLLNHEDSANTNNSSQEYELHPVPNYTNNIHTISRKPLPTSSTRQHSLTFERANSSRDASTPEHHESSTSGETTETLHNEIGESFRDNESHLDYPFDSGRQIQTDDSLFEHNHHPSSATRKHSKLPVRTGLRLKSSFVHRLWIWEITASVVSLVCMASIIGVLSYEQGRRLDEWGLGKGFFSPTVLVSLLGTLAKSACLLVLTEVISQLKWLHFQNEPQRLSDLQLFDDASRGPWGALKLASTRNRKTVVASFSCILVVLSLLVDPFIQSVFRLPLILTPVEGIKPAILETRTYDPLSRLFKSGGCTAITPVEPKMEAAILASISNTTIAPSLPCNFEQCNWPTITTMGVCSSCEDLTHTAIPNCTFGTATHRLIDCNYTIPSRDTTLNAVFGMLDGSSMDYFYPDHTVWSSVAGYEWKITLDDAWNPLRTPSFSESRRAIINQ